MLPQVKIITMPDFGTGAHDRAMRVAAEAYLTSRLRDAPEFGVVSIEPGKLGIPGWDNFYNQPTYYQIDNPRAGLPLESEMKRVVHFLNHCIEEFKLEFFDPLLYRLDWVPYPPAWKIHVYAADEAEE